MNPYDHDKIEKKWQKVWESKKPNKVKEDPQKKKFFALIEFPYPSGDGLHVGHIRSNTAMDIIARKRRREGYNVLYPIGWDAFGLPTENYAIKTGIQPSVVTKNNTDTFRRQLKALGFSFDWSREVNTTDPKYYKWTQWIFLQFLKKGLAYKKKLTINWCPKDLIGLANEEVIDGCCERCGTKVEQKEKEQWMLAITKYADRLDNDLDETDFLEKIKIQQRNWIGKSEGAEIEFPIKGSEKKIKVYTTRPDTLFGVTYVVLAPGHTLIDEFINKADNTIEVAQYIKTVREKDDEERTNAKTAKTGVELKGIRAINPVNNEEVPIWIADYVLADYGTGAVMAVPAHDERDFEFAKRYSLDVKQVIAPYFENTTDLALRKDLPLVEREIIHAIVKNPKTNKFLVIKWKEHNWQSFVTGGMEKGEDIVDAARREVLEESGYKNLKHINMPGSAWQVHSAFFAKHKNENRYMKARGILFELENEEKIGVSPEEQGKHDLMWIDEKEVGPFLTYENQRLVWNYLEGNSKTLYSGFGKLVNSSEFSGKDSESIKKEITQFAGGQWVTKFKLRDWIFSRQRYWGEPIPVVHCIKCGIVPIPEKNLPVELPKVKNYAPTENGESPLAAIEKWVNTKCPTCKGTAKRETDTMPNWAGSSWYYLRYADPSNKKVFADAKNLKYWTPVDWYNGGMEHTTLHLLYSRFWHKFLFDLGLVPTSEPYKKRTSHGLILAEGGEKMSKSKGNVINPDSIIKTVGADALRIHEMFMGPFDQAIAWDTNTIAGSRRFIERIWKLQEKIGTTADEKLEVVVHKTIKKVSEDIEEMKFNTAISAMMIAVNDFEKSEKISRGHYEILVQLLAPFAPHVSEELWAHLGNKTSVHASVWPMFDPKKLTESTVTMTVQVNGKMRGTIECAVYTDDATVEKMALDKPEIAKWTKDLSVKKVIIIKNKLINIVVG
ncbi:MAG: leucyl-tRNA synthetase [Patescibacteria group bacterium]|nr:leucyl-tRNA synthetase [Patescibacteria group bacterium]